MCRFGNLQIAQIFSRKSIVWLPAFLFICLLSACTGGDRKLIFQDSFTLGQTGSWQTEGDDAGITAIENGRLLVKINSPNTIQFSTLSDPQFTDFSLEIEATLLDGSPNDSYGLLFRMQESVAQKTFAFYRFEITGDGFYIFERHNADGTWVRLTDGWQETEAINAGIGATNKLSILAGGSSFSLFINDTALGQFSDQNGLLQGKIAVDAGTFGNPGLTVAFDNLVIREP